MTKRRWLAAVIAAAAAAVVVTAVALPLFQPWRLFTDKFVDEALPSAVPISTQSSSTTPPTVSAKQLPAPAKLMTGTLISHEHETSGTVVVLHLADDSRVLRLQNLKTSDGPDLKVWLSDAPVIPGRAGWHVFDDGRYVSLGSLKGNHGNQNYPIPADVNPEDFRSVVIWCDRFNVSFGAATLTKA